MEREGELFIENSCSPEEQEKLAQSFSDNASRKAKGSGMGLFVVRVYWNMRKNYLIVLR